MYMLLLTLIYLAFISLGLPDSLLGSAWPTMHAAFSMPLSAAGMISMIISGGTICSSLLAERLIHRFSTRIVTVASVFLTAAALFGFSLSTRFWMLCLWAIPYGLGAGAIDSALNNHVAMHYSSRHMSWLHCFWGVGTIISPYIMSYAITNASWQAGYRGVSLLQLGIFLVLLLTLPVWRCVGHEAAADSDSQVLGLRRALQIPGAKALLLGFFAYCAAEATAMLWASSYLVNVRQISAERAAAFASLFFIGMTVGRFAAGLLPERFRDQNRIRLGAAVAFCGIVCILLPIRSDSLCLAGFVILGLGCAPIYPSIIHSTPANFGAENSQALIGIQMASAYVGSTFMPPLFGLLGTQISLRILPFYLAAFLVLMLVMLEHTCRKIQAVK